MGMTNAANMQIHVVTLQNSRLPELVRSPGLKFACLPEFPPALQPQHSGFHFWEIAGVSAHQLLHAQPSELPRQASFLNSSGTHWHHAGTSVALVLSGASASSSFEPSHTAELQLQHSGFQAWEIRGVLLHQSMQVQPLLLPRHASALKG